VGHDGTVRLIGADRPLPRPAETKIPVAGSSLARATIFKVTGSGQTRTTQLPDSAERGLITVRATFSTGACLEPASHAGEARSPGGQRHTVWRVEQHVQFVGLRGEVVGMDQGSSAARRSRRSPSYVDCPGASRGASRHELARFGQESKSCSISGFMYVRGHARMPRCSFALERSGVRFPLAPLFGEWVWFSGQGG
jgi:hypothetical protein